MTEVEYHRSLYDPPKRKGLFGVPPHVLIASIVVVSLLFGLLAFYFVNAQFKLREVNYSDDSVDVELIEPIPPPPPPPPPPETAPPPKLQVRVPAPLPVNIPVPPLPVPPTPKEDRIASTIPPGRIDGPVTIPLPPPPPKPPEISNVTWQRQPAPEFPERAASRGIEQGTVQLVCNVSANGSATNCSIVSEDPSGAGFGREALRSMSRARFSPRTVDGVAEGGRARFTIRFRLAE